jgi:prepilin-type processing-associated H-X9-DG protein
LRPPPVQNGPLTYYAEPAAQRVLVACATISIQTPGPLPPPSGTVGTPSNSKKYTGGYSYDMITTGGYRKPHLSPHLNGKTPSGGNIGFMDGHVEWRKFADMQFRGYSDTCPVFWW